MGVINWLAEIKSAAFKKKNDNMPGKSVMLQVEATAGDVENVELYRAPGVLAVPATGGQVIMVDAKRGRVAIAHHDYRVDIDVAEGETAVYSTDTSGSVQSKIVLRADGTIELNGNSKKFVTWDELNTALTTLCATLTSHVHASLGSPSPGLVDLSCDISSAKTTTLKTGG